MYSGDIGGLTGVLEGVEEGGRVGVLGGVGVTSSWRACKAGHHWAEAAGLETHKFGLSAVGISQ